MILNLRKLLHCSNSYPINCNISTTSSNLNKKGTIYFAVMIQSYHVLKPIWRLYWTYDVPDLIHTLKVIRLIVSSITNWHYQQETEQHRSYIISFSLHIQQSQFPIDTCYVHIILTYDLYEYNLHFTLLCINII